MGTRIDRIIPNDQYDALINAANPSASNPFATLADRFSIGVVSTFSALPDASLNNGKFYWVENTQGTKWLPGSLGGTFYNKGLYYSNGVGWQSIENPYQATQAEVDAGSVSDRFVTPNTLYTSSQWGTKSDKPTTKIVVSSLANLIATHSVNGSNEIQLTNAVYVFDLPSFEITGYTLVGHTLGTTLSGHSQNINTLLSTEDGISLIKSDGNLFIDQLNITTSGVGSQALNLTGSSGFESLDMFYTAFIDCTKIGTITSFRQGFWTTGFAMNCGSGITLNGAWLGGFTIFNSRIMGVSGALLLAGTSFTCDSIRSNVYITVPSGSTAFDFDYNNFNEDNGYQLQGCRVDGDGQMVSNFSDAGRDTDDAWKSRRSVFVNNVGSKAKNTYIGGEWKCSVETITPLTLNVPAKLLGTTPYYNLEHLTQTVSNAFIHNSSVETVYSLDGSIIVSGTASDIIRLEVRKWNTILSAYEVINTYRRAITNLVGSVDIAYFSPKTGRIYLNQNDRVELWVTNESSNSSITMLVDSFLFMNVLK